MPKTKLDQLNQSITKCQKCPRLIDHIQAVSEKKVKRFKEWEYWGKPVPGFGDPQARIVIIGLAPAAHGANRTGRMFTGDKSGDWLYGALYEAGLANQPDSTDINDGMQLYDTYITAACHCAPPQNKPTKEEIKTCSETHLKEELATLAHKQYVLCLGRVAFDTYRKLYDLPGMRFGHGVYHPQDKGPDIQLSYHPSRQNTQTGRLKWDSWVKVFKDLTKALD